MWGSVQGRSDRQTYRPEEINSPLFAILRMHLESSNSKFLFFSFVILKMKTLRFNETSITVYHMTRSYVTDQAASVV